MLWETERLMARRIKGEDGWYRERRGELVRIPDEWVGQTVHPQTKRKRDQQQAKPNSKRAGIRKGN